MKKPIGAVLTICVALVFAWPYLWFRVPHSEVARDGKLLPGSRVYRNSSGALLVDLGQPNGRSYLIAPSGDGVGIPAYGFWLDTPVVLATRHAPLLCVALGTAKTDSPDPKLRLGTNTAEFFDYDGHPVRLTW